jgi:hypothetical protein
MTEIATDTTPTPEAAPTAVPVLTPEAARELLVKQGLHVLTREQLEDRIRRAEKPGAAARTELEQARADAAAAQAKLREIENLGKSTADVIAQQREEALRRLAEMEKLLTSERERTATAERSRVEALRDVKLGSLLSGAVDPDAALMLAKARVPGLSAEPDGTLIHTDGAGIVRKGPEAETVVKAWWTEQKWQHAAPAPGPGTRGSATEAPPVKAEIRSVDHLDRIEEARRLNAERAAKRG